MRGRAGAEPDRETRARLLEEARRLFAAQGFRRVTVREICRAANANVAAINYHFGDKLGLYREVLDERDRDHAGRPRNRRARQERAARPSRSCAPTSASSCSASARSHDSWIHQMMTHEMAEPTDALDHVVREVIAPRIDYMRELVADILEVSAEDERVLRCVLSVQSQFHAAMANPVSKRLVPGFSGDPAAVDRLAQHIADFSIGGIALRRR